ncbi:hypothetical protein PIB30_009328 [Stylosanthes scabra]|uniref:Uncharacterized protein n=1 Tax=Stylosanthes scabra TaxID=79078 RepID=A0ABU6U4I0_9FABA|nr:hypothetical protein [Stylosanthes scabra]
MRLGIASWSFILITLVFLVVKDGCARKITEETEADNQLMKPSVHHDLKQSPTIMPIEVSNVKLDDLHKQHKDKANEDDDDDDDHHDHDHDHDHDDHHHHHHLDHENDHA